MSYVSFVGGVLLATLLIMDYLENMPLTTLFKMFLGNIVVTLIPTVITVGDVKVRFYCFYFSVNLTLVAYLLHLVEVKRNQK